MKKFTPQQRKAINSPCYLGCEVVNPAFRKGCKSWSEILTVNVGYE